MPEDFSPRDQPARSLLVTGGARSGKTAFAQACAEASRHGLLFIATAQAHDSEMARRIALHRAARGTRWTLLEEPLDLVRALEAEARRDRLLLVDCLTLWLSNIMLAGSDPARETAALAAALPELAGSVIFVTNEVGSGIVPDNRLARDFRDVQGRLNQAMAAACDAAVLVAAGLPLVLKPTRQPLPRL